MTLLLLPGDAPAWTIALPLELVHAWADSLGADDVIGWCDANRVRPYELLSDRVYVHGWADGRRLVQIANQRLPDGTDRGGGRALPHVRSLPEGVGHLIRWDQPEPPAPARHLHLV